MDKYDKAVAYLTEHPSAIWRHWAHPRSTVGGCLFQVAARNGSDFLGRLPGCLTQIRAKCGLLAAETRELTEQIENDERIPDGPGQITVADLPVFAEWQRRLDRELSPAEGVEA